MVNESQLNLQLPLGFTELHRESQLIVHLVTAQVDSLGSRGLVFNSSRQMLSEKHLFPLPAQQKTAARHSQRTAGEHSGAFWEMSQRFPSGGGGDQERS